MCLGALRGEHSLKVSRSARAVQRFPLSVRKCRPLECIVFLNEFCRAHLQFWKDNHPQYPDVLLLLPHVLLDVSSLLLLWVVFCTCARSAPTVRPQCKVCPKVSVRVKNGQNFPLGALSACGLSGHLAHGGRLPVRVDTNLPPPLFLTPQPIVVSTWLELAIWALAAPGKFFERGKFANHLISPHLFTFKMVTMS